MQTQVIEHTVPSTNNKSDKVKKYYVIAFKCPNCTQQHYVDDFEGEKSIECSLCGQDLGVTAGWAQ